MPGDGEIEIDINNNEENQAPNGQALGGEIGGTASSKKDWEKETAAERLPGDPNISISQMTRTLRRCPCSSRPRLWLSQSLRWRISSCTSGHSIWEGPALSSRRGTIEISSRSRRRSVPSRIGWMFLTLRTATAGTLRSVSSNVDRQARTEKSSWKLTT